MKESRNRIIIYVVCIILALLCVGVYLKKTKKHIDVNAIGENSVYTATEQWQAGTLTNITAENGSIKMTAATASKLDLLGMYNLDNSKLTSAGAGTNPIGIIDGNNDSMYLHNWTYGLPNCDTSPETYVQFDLGAVNTVSKISGSSSAHHLAATQMKVSSDGSNFTLLTELGAAGDDPFEYNSPVTFRYIRLQARWIYEFGCGVSPGGGINELELWRMGGNHTTPPIDGGANFWSWDANTIAQTVPANTTATYQYRTSANGTDWTAWVGAIGSVTSRTGDDSNNPTRYRYLQVKATLANTDGVSTPTIDSYTIDYHTEIKPTAPSAQTAVVQ